MISSILVPYDGSSCSIRALELACDLAAKYEARITLLHVVTGHKVPEELAHFAEREHLHGEGVAGALGERLLDDAEKTARDAGINVIKRVRVDGDPAAEVLRSAKDGVDLIVIGSRGFGELKGLLLGSVSHKVTQLAPCACITVR